MRDTRRALVLIGFVISALACGSAPAGSSPQDDGTPHDTSGPVDVAAAVDLPIAPDASPELEVESETSAPMKVLFIGNSYTYVNDLPSAVRQLAASASPPVDVATDSVTKGGARLVDLAETTKALDTIGQGGWTWVVLQGQSVEPALDVATFLSGAKTLGDKAAFVGAKVALYETWPRAVGSDVYADTWSGGTPAALFAALQAGYEQAAEETGGVLVPVGEAWMEVLATHPEIALYQPDGSHPSPAGTYLAACVFVAVLAHIDPVGLPWHPAEVSAADAAVLQGAAASVVEAE